MEIRRATETDWPAIWSIIGPVFAAGETYSIDPEISEDGAKAYWLGPAHETYVADDDMVLGTYFLRANQGGGGAHVANCGYMTSAEAQGKGVARAMCAHSLIRAKERGFLAMQFNFVVATNERAVKLWQTFGFEILTRLPEAFRHPKLGFVDALVMFKRL